MSAAIAIAVGVRADSWQIEVPSLMRSVAAPHHASGVERVGAVRLRGPTRVEPEPLGLCEPLGHAGRRTGAPVSDHVPELHGPAP